jgi:hypothetical protein
MSLPDSFYLALCMTVLLVGAVYWVWTQIQFVQRKVNVLENIVYELKTLCSKQHSSPDPVIPLPAVSYPPAPSSVLGEDEDLLHETLQKEIEEVDLIAPPPEEQFDIEETVKEENTTPAITEFKDFSEEQTVLSSEDLQPGGVGSGDLENSLNSALDTMSIKELRRLAEQRGIHGAKDKKRKDLIEAIRATPSTPFF